MRVATAASGASPAAADEADGGEQADQRGGVVRRAGASRAGSGPPAPCRRPSAKARLARAGALGSRASGRAGPGRSVGGVGPQAGEQEAGGGAQVGGVGVLARGRGRAGGRPRRRGRRRGGSRRRRRRRARRPSSGSPAYIDGVGGDAELAGDEVGEQEQELVAVGGAGVGEQLEQEGHRRGGRRVAGALVEDVAVELPVGVLAGLAVGGGERPDQPGDVGGGAVGVRQAFQSMCAGVRASFPRDRVPRPLDRPVIMPGAARGREDRAREGTRGACAGPRWPC
jgi:hypothetical protein